MVIAFFVILFAIFPLTDTDIWWHLACAREWVTTWTPVRTPVINVHEYFQQVVGLVYGLGGAPLLVAFKAVLWGVVFALFIGPQKIKFDAQSLMKFIFVPALLFLSFQLFEIRPVLFSLLFLGVYWNAIPWLAKRWRESRFNVKLVACAVMMLAIQWIWCKCQGLYILGPIFVTLVLCASLHETKKQCGFRVTSVVPQVAFVLLLWLMPFLHREGLALFLYPFGLLDRLLGLTPSAAVFASQIAENRSPITLLMAGENKVDSVLMILLSLAGMILVGLNIARIVRRQNKTGGNAVKYLWLFAMAILALVAERNFVLFLPVFIAVVKNETIVIQKPSRVIAIAFIACFMGIWAKSLSNYDLSMVAYQRVPVQAAAWMSKHPHSGRLFNDDRAGGYLALKNPADSIYLDGRFILKTADFFERYLEYAQNPSLFLADADSLGIDRALFPLQYYARWDNLMFALDRDMRWHLVYRDKYFAVFDKR